MATGQKTGHAERIITRQLEDAKVPYKNVKRIYSELDACNACTSDILKKKFAHAKGFYSFEFNSKGKQMWQAKLNELYRYLSNKK